MFVRAIGLIMALLSVSAPAEAQRSTREMRDLKPREVKRVLRDDLLSILAMPGEVTRGNRRQLGDTAIPTRPVGSGIKGLCQRDLLLLHYAPSEPAPAGRDREQPEDVPIRAYGLEAERHYFFTRLPEEAERDGARPFHPRFSEDCSAGTASLWEGWFAAPSAEDAIVGALVLRAAAKAVAAGRVALSGCEDGNVEAAEQCRSDLARTAADPKMLGSIGTCPTETGQLCYAIEAGGAVFTIVARLSGGAMSPDRIVSVKHEANIIVT